jgi:hypothetical protein
MLGNLYQYRDGRYMVRFRSICKRFKDKKEAERFLTGLRYEVDKGSFDPRDYQRDKPLGFEILIQKYLDRKKDLKSIGKVKYHLSMAISYFHNKNVKEIGYGELEDFLYSLSPALSSKTRKNVMDSLFMRFSNGSRTWSVIGIRCIGCRNSP